MKPTKPLTGLQKVCKAVGRIKCGDTMMVWDYANDIAMKESEMPIGSERWRKSEMAKWVGVRE